MLKIDILGLKCCPENINKYTPDSFSKKDVDIQKNSEAVKIDISSLARESSINSYLSDVGSVLGKIVMDSARVSYSLQQIENRAAAAEINNYENVENSSELGDYLVNLTTASMKIDASKALLAQSGISIDRIYSLLV